MKFIGHLDLMRYFQKAMRRAQIPIAFTEGYSPHMIMSFAQPLGIGVTSDGEYMDIELKEPVSSKDAIFRLNQVMVEGIEIMKFLQIPEDKKYSGMTMVSAADYQVRLQESFASSEITRNIPEEWAEKMEEFLLQPQIVVLKKTKRSEKEIDIKPMIYHMKMTKENILLFLAAGSEQNLKPELVMNSFLKYLGLNPEEVPLHYHRTEVYANNFDKEVENAFLPLDAFGKEIL